MPSRLGIVRFLLRFGFDVRPLSWLGVWLMRRWTKPVQSVQRWHSIIARESPELTIEEEQLPTIEEMSGSIPNITGGLSLTEHMDSIRGAYKKEEGGDPTCV